MPHRLRNAAAITGVPSADDLTLERVLWFPSDERWDATELDLSDPSQITLQQTDDHGVSHTIILSPAMITNMRLHVLKWLSANNPT